MRSIIFLIVATLFTSCATTSSRESMEADVDQAVSIIERFEAIPESAIPPAVMRAARGLAILTVTKAAFIGGARGGTGIVVARTEKGWSGPSAIGTGGLGVGFQAGVEVAELVIVLNTQEAVNAFAKGGNVTLGGALGCSGGSRGTYRRGRRGCGGGCVYLQPQPGAFRRCVARGNCDSRQRPGQRWVLR